MYDSVITLMSDGTRTYDSYGTESMTYTERKIYAMPRGVYSSEFYNAAQAGLHPSITFDVANKIDYNFERLLKWEGKLYNVIRVDWTAQRDKISLVCEERVNNG